MGINGKVVIITGGAKGIGGATSVKFGSLGAAVVIADTDEDSALSIKAELTSQGVKCIFVLADVAEESHVKEIRKATLAAYGRIDILVNNAGIGHDGTVVDDSPQEWDRVIAVNLRAAYLCSHFCIPELMKCPGSSIINVGSVQSIFASSRSAAYVTSKFGLLGLTKAMAVDHAPTIRVNAVLPGSIDTQMFRRNFANQKDYETRIEGIQEKHLLRRIGSAEDVANTIAFLASEEASFITGTAFVVDGGLTTQV